jgi:hypothetical protein
VPAAEVVPAAGVESSNTDVWYLPSATIGGVVGMGAEAHDEAATAAEMEKKVRSARVLV